MTEYCYALIEIFDLNQQIIAIFKSKKLAELYCKNNLKHSPVYHCYVTKDYNFVKIQKCTWYDDSINQVEII